MSNCNGVAFSADGSKLLVSDSNNNRVLIWNTVPATNGVQADVVIGQTDFVTATGGASATKMTGPDGLSVTPDGKLLVCDKTNNRVLIFNSIPTSNGAPPRIARLTFPLGVLFHSGNCPLSSSGK